MFSKKICEFLSFSLARMKLMPPSEQFPIKRSVRDQLIESSVEKLDHYTALTVFSPKEATVMYVSVLDFSGTDFDIGEFLSLDEYESMMKELEHLSSPQNPRFQN